VDPETGRFKPPEELRRLYEGRGVTPDREVITNCSIGERAAHTWFVLKYILKYPAVRLYDGSWAVWGNPVGAPVKRGNEPKIFFMNPLFCRSAYGETRVCHRFLCPRNRCTLHRGFIGEN
jgi:hypothetical protein